LVYSSIFLFAVYSLLLKIKNSEFRLLDAFLLGILFFHWVAISASREGWWGGHSYGPRLFSDMLPYLLYFLIPTIRQLAPPITVRKAPLIALVALLAGISFFMHFRGATETATAFGWNWQTGTVVGDVNDDPSRLWDWSDPPFLRGLRPPILDVAPRSLSVQVEEGTTHPQFPGFLVANVGDRDLVWQAKPPGRIRILSTSEPKGGELYDPEVPLPLPPGSSTLPVAMTIDLEGYEPGVHSLGAILVSAGSIDGKPLRGSPIAIPIAVKVLPASDHPARELALSGPNLVFMPLVRGGTKALVSMPPDIAPLHAPPPDIFVNGATQTLAEDRIQAFYGTGWYDLERLDSYSWRWAKSPAEIYIHSPSRRTIKLGSKPAALYEPGSPTGKGDLGSLWVSVNHQDRVELVVQREQLFEVDLELVSGWNVITLELQAGNMRPADLDPANGDLRQLSFSVSAVNLTEE
jgi:hypothetical protein